MFRLNYITILDIIMASNQITQNTFYPIKIFPKKPYNKVEIDAIRNKINERVEYLKTYEPIIYMRRQADIKLTNLYHQLNSYDLNL